MAQWKDDLFHRDQGRLVREIHGQFMSFNGNVSGMPYKARSEEAQPDTFLVAISSRLLV